MSKVPALLIDLEIGDERFHTASQWMPDVDLDEYWLKVLRPVMVSLKLWSEMPKRADQ